MDLERPLYYRRGGKVDQVSGWRRRCLFAQFECLKIISAGKDGFQFLEVMGTNVLANEVVRHFSNLTTKECWELGKRVLLVKHASGGITDFNSNWLGCMLRFKIK